MEPTIGGIKASAPLWNKADYLTLIGIVELLSNASYHYADDSGGEWSKARLAVQEAAAIVNRLKLCYDAISFLYQDKPQLLGFNLFIDAIIKDARK